MKTADLCRKHGISEASFYNWKAKYGGLEVSEAKRLKGLESENARLKKRKGRRLQVDGAVVLILSKQHLQTFGRLSQSPAVLSVGVQAGLTAP